MIDEVTPEQRVAVAKDVIAQVKIEKYRVRNFGYLTMILKNPMPLAAKDLRDVVDLPTINCTVCAKGAMILSYARLFDGVPLEPYIVGSDCIAWANDKSEKTLSHAFGKSNADMIEMAFEKHCIGPYSPSSPDVHSAIEFGLQYSHPPDRLIAIMENLIANNGDFIP